MKLTSLHLCSPSSEMAYVIAKFIHKYRPWIEIVGVYMPDEYKGRRLSGIKKYIYSDSIINQVVDSALVPTGAVSTKYFLENWKKVRVGDITLNENALQVYDKPRFLLKSEKVGVPIPKTWATSESVPMYPVFYKQKFERGGGIRGIAFSCDQIPKSERRQLIFQEIINGEGTYGVAFLANNGKLLAVHTHFESISFPKEGGSAVVIENYNDYKLIDYVSRLIETFEYSGWGLAEFKYCPKRQDYILMEINAKFWASCEFTFVNNPTFLKMLFGIDSHEKQINKMIFINRALNYNLFFTAKIIAYNFKDCSFQKYPGLIRKLILSIIPKGMRQVIRLITH